MKIKKTFLTIAIGVFMVFSLSFATSETFAYFVSSVSGDSDIVAASVTAGSWDQSFPWDVNDTYITGDVVSHNGVDYRAKKDNPTKEPGVDGGWTSQWTAL